MGLAVFVGLIATVASSSTAKAPQDGLILANDIVIQNNFISSLNRRTVGTYDKLLVSELIAKYDWDTQIAYAIVTAESGGNPNAINETDNHGVCYGSFGLFQVGCIHADREDLLDPEKNVKIAYDLWKREGWQPWTTYINGSYKIYLD